MIKKGIDLRKIKCANNEEGTIQSGISWDETGEGENILRFHFWEIQKRIDDSNVLIQTNKAMFLDETNAKEIVDYLTYIFPNIRS